MKRTKILKMLYELQHEIGASDYAMGDAVFAWMVDTAQSNGCIIAPESSCPTRRFYLRREQDVSGVSGTGIVADGVIFGNGTTVIQWRGPRPSTVVWASLEDAHAIHSHGGATKFVFVNDQGEVESDA